MNILEIKKYDIVNGPGIRCSIWVAGCNNNCKGCWSPHTWNPNQGKSLKESINEIKEAIYNPKVTGISILGGDPFYHLFNGDYDDIVTLLLLCHQSRTPVWVWTGYRKEQIDKKLQELRIPNLLNSFVDVLIDGPFDITKKDMNLEWRGSSNQRIIDVKKTAKDNKIIELK